MAVGFNDVLSFSVNFPQLQKPDLNQDGLKHVETTNELSRNPF
jgi:hypothetical protein